jgi:hypothetical protein
MSSTLPPNTQPTQKTAGNSDEKSPALATLETAVQANRQERPDPGSVTSALLDRERRAKQTPSAIGLDDILGTWQLRFTAPKKPTYKSGQPTSNGFYVPTIVQATLRFKKDEDRSTGLEIQNQLRLGTLKLKFIGPAKLLPNKNLLAFDFERLQLGLGNLTLFSFPVRGGRSVEPAFEAVPVGKLPFFAFFTATQEYIAARGRGGGLALWRRQA